MWAQLNGQRKDQITIPESFRKRFGQRGCTVSDALHQFSYDIVGVVASYAFPGTARQGAELVSLGPTIHFPDLGIEYVDFFVCDNNGGYAIGNRTKIIFLDQNCHFQFSILPLGTWHHVVFDANQKAFALDGIGRIMCYDLRCRHVYREIRIPSNPGCFSIDRKGNFYIGLGTRIEVFDATGRRIESFRTQTPSIEQILVRHGKPPSVFTRDSSGCLHVFSKNGWKMTSLSSETVKESHAHCFDRRGQILCLDRHANRVDLFSDDGKLIAKFECGEIHRSLFLSIDHEGNLCIATMQKMHKFAFVA